MSRTVWLLCSAFVVGAVVIGKGQAQSAPTHVALPDFTGIVKKNTTAVVHVEARYNGHRLGVLQGYRSGRSGPEDGLGDEDSQWLFRHFFGMPVIPSPQERAHISLGSGFIISSDGYILTNNHVVAHASSVKVRLKDRRVLPAKVVGTDANYDIALLKVKADKPLHAVHIGDSRMLKPGQWVLAIGSPFGFDYTVTQGIVSAVGRSLGEKSQDTTFIQTDVPINRGNSGGPLFNLSGQVVGINSQIYSNTGGYMGVSFSIPIDVAMNVVRQLKARGYVTHGMLGVMVRQVDSGIAKALHLERASGAIVVKVTPGSGADRAGIQTGDIIIAYHGHPVDQSAALPPLVAMTSPGKKVAVTVLRNGKKLTLMATVGSMPGDHHALARHGLGPVSSGIDTLGIAVKNLDHALGQKLGLKTGQGVVISRITGTIAMQAGLQVGDVILMVNQHKVSSLKSFRKAARLVKPGDMLLLLVRRGNETNFISLSIPLHKSKP